MAGVDSLAPVGLLRPRAFAHLRVRRRACVLMTRFPRRRRSGRFGRKGVSINFVTAEDERLLQDIQRFYQTVIEELPSNVADLI